MKNGRVIFALWFLSFVNYLERVTISFAGPAIMKSLHMSPAAFGIVLSSFGIGYLMAHIPGGLLSDRLGSRALLTVGPLFWALFTGATGLVATMAGFVAVRVCLGLSEGISSTSIYKTLGDNFAPEKRSRALAIASTAIPLAPALAGTLIGKLTVAYGWPKMFFIMAAPALVVSGVCYLLIPARRTARSSPPVSGPQESTLLLKSLVTRPSLWILSLAAFAWNIPYWGFLGWMPSYLALARHIDLKAIGPLASMPYIGAFFGLLVGGWLGSTRLHKYCIQLVVAFFVGAAVSLFLAYQAQTLPLALAGLTGTAFFLFGSSGPVAKIVLDLAPEGARATYVGFYNTVAQVGGVLAPALIGFLVSATGSFASGFGFMVASLCAAAALLLVLTSPRLVPLSPVSPA